MKEMTSKIYFWVLAAGDHVFKFDYIVEESFLIIKCPNALIIHFRHLPVNCNIAAAEFKFSFICFIQYSVLAGMPSSWSCNWVLLIIKRVKKRRICFIDHRSYLEKDISTQSPTQVVDCTCSTPIQFCLHLQLAVSEDVVFSSWLVVYRHYHLRKLGSGVLDHHKTKATRYSELVCPVSCTS